MTEKKVENLNFRKLELDDIDKLWPYFMRNLCRICDCTIGGTFMWRDFFDTEYAIEGGHLYLKVTYLNKQTAFTPPRGDFQEEDISKIIEYCKSENIPPVLCAVSESRMNEIKERFPEAKVYSDRAWSDYLYSADEIINLAGRKFSGQRNHMNKFRKEYEDWSFKPITEENRAEVHSFFEEFDSENVRESAAYNEGNVKTLEVVDNMAKYRQIGGALYVNGNVVGASIGEIVGDTLFVHIEKSKKEILGSYPMLMNQFAKAFAAEGVLYINREEDDGVEGLRTSKLSYHPVSLLDKYVIEING